MATSERALEFRAGLMTRAGTTVTADKRKGLVFLTKDGDEPLHMFWADRSSSNVEEELILFPGDAQWVAVPLSADTGNQLFVPKGFLHGFLTLTPDVQVVYKCSDYYAPDTDGGIRWNDPTIAIDWGVNEGDVTLSGKDADAPFLADFDTPFTFEAQS